ncbi:MAG TPA: hypothetical protein VD766_03085, partial [Solirubrobacterales bacterium]|nr:hypothetical protein [Solirubrobacterales bacterium]
AFRGWITGTLDLAEACADGIRSRDEFELMCEPSLSTVCFRHLPGSGSDLDEHNLKLAERIQRDGRVYLAAATVDGQACLRVCFVNFRTRAEDVDFALETVSELGAAL